MNRSFLQRTLKGRSTPNPYVVTHKGITGIGEVLAFCGFTINAQCDQFAPYDANDVARSTLLFARPDRVVCIVEPKRVQAKYGSLTSRVAHFVPRLHVLEENGAEFLGDVVFDFKGAPIGVITDGGDVIRLVS
ncbi:MAG: hypothetical protein K2W95_11120 [Candidatus Obscuribacterales bacterium]|nr:hypothetical protein [Candidatus Obscuribacterales bacterium]